MRFTVDKWIIIFTVVSAALLQMIDTSIVNVTLIQMMGNLGATLGDISWVITGYAAANVIMITLSGWLSAKFGRRNYFAASIIIFTIGSILCGTSTSVWELVAFRVLQGIGGGGILTTAQAILIQTFSKEELGMATAIYGLGVIIGPTIGPTLGGYITDNLSWQWVFFINIPVGILATILTFLYIKEPHEKIKTGKMDWIAIVLLVAGVGSLQVILEKGESEDWFDTKYITVLTIVAVIGLAAFIWRELVKKNPVVDLRLMRKRRFAVGTLFNFILGFGLFASVFIVPVFCQNLLGFTASQTGWLLMPGALASGIMMPIVGTLLKKNYISPVWYAGIGFVLFFIFTWMLSNLTLDTGPDQFYWPLIIRGVGMGFIFIPLTTISLMDLEGKEIPQGTAISNMVRQLGGAFGTAIMATYIATRSVFHKSVLASHVSIYNTPTYDRVRMITGLFMSKGDNPATANSKAIAVINGMVTKQAYVLTYGDTFLVIGGFFLVCIPLLLLFIGKRKSKAPLHIELAAE